MSSRGSWIYLAGALCLGLTSAGCVPALSDPPREVNKAVPERYTAPGVASEESATEVRNDGELLVNEFFDDPHLNALIDSALEHNQELNIVSLEILIAQNEVLARSGEYLPRVELRGGGGVRREGEDTTRFEKESNDGEYLLGLFASWEIDVWKKLRNARSAAAKRYLASVEGRKFLVTNLVAEIAEAYYELMALDNQLDVLRQNIEIQQEALDVVRLQKQAGKVTELAVKRFEAEVLKNKSRQYFIRQQIVETENRLNFLAGRYRQPVERSSLDFMQAVPAVVHEGVPADLLENRPDVTQAELALEAAKLDVEVAKAQFYPSLEINAGVAVQEAFELAEFPSSPWSLAYGVFAELVQPLWNRRGLTAEYFSANSEQMQAVFAYERTVLTAFNEVANQLSMIENLETSYSLRAQEVERLTESITISSNLFTSARADYMEVLLTRRDALEAQMELIETKGRQMKAMVKLYRALGGGWK
ncbi:MAG: efflux transporter outer membrane subunit [Planctomycetes bacterium]|nr:efflux transporter outer membrane subunit [Planctomycetota bacterium]